MARLNFYLFVFSLLFVGSICGPSLTNQVQTHHGETEDQDGSESSHFSFQNLFRRQVLPYQSGDPLDEPSSIYHDGQQPTQQYALKPTQQFAKYAQQPFLKHPQMISQLYQQQNFPYLSIPTPLQSSNPHGNPLLPSQYSAEYRNPPYINNTLLVNVEKLLQKIEPELTELNKTRTMIWNAKTVTLEVDYRLAPVVTVGGRSLSLGPRRGIQIFVISDTNGQIVDGVVFDLAEPGNSVRLINYLDAVGVGSYVVIVSSQDAFLSLNQSVRNYLVALGSQFATFLNPNDRWIFVARVKPLTTSLAIAETRSNAPDCPSMNPSTLSLIVKLLLE